MWCPDNFEEAEKARERWCLAMKAEEERKKKIEKSEIQASMNADYDFNRFYQAQDHEFCGYKDALLEIKNGCKYGHWIWYIFPQIKGLGHSYNSNFYGIGSLEEAATYLEDNVLGGRLREISSTLLNLEGKAAKEIFGHTDAMKVKSCMTLFDIVSPHDIFEQVLEKYYNGKRCNLTLKRFEKL